MFLFRNRMVAEIEGSPAGASGPGAAPAAPAAAPAAAPGVTGPAAPAGQRTSFLQTIAGRPAAAAPGAGDDDLEAAIRADPDGKGIPHDRVRTMRGSWETRARQQERESLMRELAPFLQEFQELKKLRGEMDPAAIKTGIAQSLLKALGVEEEPPKPRFITEEDFQKRLREDRESYTREAQHREDLGRAQLELQERKTKHANYFQHFPWIEDVAAAVWGTKFAIENRLGIGQIIDGLVKQMGEGIGAYNDAYAKDKEREAEVVPVVPGSAPAPGTKKPAKADMSPEGVAARSRALRLKLAGEGR